MFRLPLLALAIPAVCVAAARHPELDRRAPRYRFARRRRLAVAVILTKRRNADDVFLIGEESLLGDQGSGDDPDPTAASEPAADELLASPVATPSPNRPLGSLQGARGIALLGLGAAAAATLGVLELSGGGGPVPVQPTTPARSPLIMRSAASAPVPAEVRRPSVVHHRQPRPERPHPTHRRPAVEEASEPEREPTPTVAPVSSPMPEPTPVPSPPPASAPAVPPAPPSPPPPSSSGGGSGGAGGVEQFGFEG